jgi:hypothetical protein
MHPQRECARGVVEDSTGVTEVEWVTPSGSRRRPRLASLRRRRRSGNANGFLPAKHWVTVGIGVAESSFAPYTFSVLPNTGKQRELPALRFRLLLPFLTFQQSSTGGLPKSMLFAVPSLLRQNAS